MGHRWHGAFIAMLVVSGAAGAEDDPLKQAAALEASIQKILAGAEPSVACILISRSEAYQRFPLCQRHPSTGQPGNLGDFHFEKAIESTHFNLSMQDLARRLNLAAPDRVPDGYGSGVVIHAGGLVLTNFHVVKDATKIFVRFANKTGSYANIHAADERSDLAVLKLLDPPTALQALKRDKEPAFRKGQFVLAITHPFAAGFRDGSPSVSWGMLSNLRRRVPGEPNEIDLRRPRLHYYGILLQTDFRLNLGASGGALVDLQGNWIGLTTAQAALAGGEALGGFAIPIDARFNRIIDTLARGEEVEYGFLGVALHPQAEGAVIRTISPGGPAEGQLRENDRIVRINGEAILEPDDLFFHVSASLAGTEISVEAQPRVGPARMVKIRLVKAHWPPSGPVIAAHRPGPVRGLRVDYTSLLYQPPAGTLTHIPKGVLVREVTPNSAAHKAGLKPDRDVIVRVNDTEVTTPKQFYASVKAAGGPVELTLADGDRKVRLP